MPEYGLLTSAIRPIPEQVSEFSRLGFDYAEIGIEAPLAVPELVIKDKGQILESLKKHNMHAIGHTAYWLQLGSSHRAVRDGWLKEARHMIDAAHALRLMYLNFHFHGGEGQTLQVSSFRREFLDSFASAVVELCAYAYKKGITLMLENEPPHKKESLRIKDFAYIFDSAPGLKVHLDVAHAFIEGGMKGVHGYVDTFSDDIVHIHMHDNHGEKDEHLSLGRGSINFQAVATMLKRIGYDRTITFEVFTSNRDAAASRDVFRQLWDK